MSILFNKVERVNPRDYTATRKWYPVLKIVSQITERQVAMEIADETTLNRNEVELVIDRMGKILIKNLLASNSVKLKDWGTFHLTCNGKGVDTKENVRADSIKSVNIRFTPGKKIREALAAATFVPVESLTGNM